MTNAEIYRLARRLCDLMESDNNDRGERVGMIWQVEGELRKVLNEIEARPEEGWRETDECPGDFSQLSRGQTKAYAWHRGVWWECDLPPLPQSTPQKERG